MLDARVFQARASQGRKESHGLGGFDKKIILSGPKLYLQTSHFFPLIPNGSLGLMVPLASRIVDVL